MKKILLTRLVPLLMMVWLPLSMPAVNTIIYNATYDFGKMTTGTDTLGGVTYTTVNYDGMFNSGEPGMPSLPVDYIKLSVPYNATNFTVTATLQNNTISNLNSYLVYPCQPSRMMNDTTPIVIIPPDASVYNSGSYYPSRNAWVVDEGFLAGENHIVTVAVMPVSYRHRALGSVTTNQLRESQTVRIVLSYDLTDTPSMYPIIRQDSTLRQEGYALTRSMVANPDNVISFAPTQMDMDPLDPNGLISGDGLNGGIEPPDPGNISHDTIAHDGGELEQMTYPYLIVTTPELKHSLRRLAALKRQKGYNVKIVTMDEVMNHPYACLGDRIKQSDGTYQVAYSDSAGCLRQYLRFAFRVLGTQYVLLAGKSIPYRHRDYMLVNPIFANGEVVDTTYETIDCVSDFYYIELNSDWSNEITDHDPDLYVGRIICESSDLINNYMDKLFRYDFNPGNGDYSYLNKAFLQEGYEFKNSLKIFNNTIKPIYDASNQIMIEELYNQLRPTGKEVIDTLNSIPVGLMCIFNHGDTANIEIYGPDASKRRLFIVSESSLDAGNGLNCLRNNYKPSIFYSPACITVPFDNKNGISMGESYTIGKNYGGPVYIGYTRKIRINRAKSALDHFAICLKNSQYVLGVADAISVSECNQDLILSSFDKQDISLIHAYIGDPSLEIWTDIPETYSGISIIRTDNTLSVTNINRDSTIVSYCSNSGIIRKQLSSSSVTLTDVSPNGSIMLYRHNCIPYIAPMLLQNVTLNKSQYVIARDVTAGFCVDSNRTNGDVIVNNGVEYEIEASGTVTLYDGFKVERGASFSVIPSTF